MLRPSGPSSIRTHDCSVVETLDALEELEDDRRDLGVVGGQDRGTVGRTAEHGPLGARPSGERRPTVRVGRRSPFYACQLSIRPDMTDGRTWPDKLVLSMNSVPVKRSDDVWVVSDPRRVITKTFVPGEGEFENGRSRTEIVISRILALPEHEVRATLQTVFDDFGDRHRDLVEVFESNFAIAAGRYEPADTLSEQQRLLIGSYFTHEYSIEAAALGNPSMVEAPDQSGLGAGETRFIMSLRAVGEGHISSIEFRSGVVGADMAITMDESGHHVATGSRAAPLYDADFFMTKLGELGALNDVSRMVLDRLDSGFTITDLEEAIRTLEAQGIDRTISFETRRILHWLASSNYLVSFPAHTEISERVIFPFGPTESHGMEDVRLVRFVHDDGGVVYYATYTAFDGYQILPQLIETTDFVSFRIATMRGKGAHNKGIALFPRKLDGRFVALGRHDNVNNFLMTSTDLRVWQDSVKLQEPERPWELTQLGNCGSPLETEAGWLVITHGVGPMRRYSLGAMLLDLDDPCRIIGHLKEPLLVPAPEERDGYVPNVVYSCGSMIHGDHLVLPYGFADVGARVATVVLVELLDHLTP